MKSTTFLTTVAMAHMALCVPVPWMAGDNVLLSLNRNVPSSAASGRDPKSDKAFVLATSHLAPGPILQKAERSFNSLWDTWKKKHGSGRALIVDNARKDIPVLVITELGELGVGIPSSSQPPSKQASDPKQKPVSASSGNEKADNVSVTEMGELSIGIPSSMSSPPSPSSSSSSSSLSSSSQPSNGTSPCPFYVEKPRDHDDVLVIFLVSAFLLVVVVVETWGPVCRSVKNMFSSKRKGAIQLAEETETKPKSFRDNSILVKSESG
ncbi:hypothetical protein GE21DRAFT_287 [Neurospora crassa]|uniref:Uncharacterized protein n=1 Tax=Neurospora crassa (strain ATCC 24698 / 74-OR23-1A / CBS 708.71 / DSM 1257 / FGSC 987) TaxID=367110 RepID=Q7SE38_NEUCR|nr:hypothetical protein NCU02138 [Neurospora crassa OR74A]EAA35060.1 hypothetical protein NCU02138 [Neurospora crassa OR74A]KHE83939.1 hypothetical protein GE21DRAFT_287 [Neurospora crassa]|eukprot:XP_964296.1 hypothetical protein NCU02138 [Neurospora crassa OR74A]